MNGKLALGAAALLLAVGQALSETRQYQLGDVDGFSGADHVYVDPAFLTWAIPQAAGYTNKIVDFDTLSADHAIVFTFVFPLSAGESVTGARLTVAMRATGADVYNDRIDLESDRDPIWSNSFRYDFSDLGWLPVADSGTEIRTIDLANAFGCYDHPAVANNLLPLLQDGNFNVMVHDDEAIDYATLTVDVVPEPATLALLALGGLAVLRRRR